MNFPVQRLRDFQGWIPEIDADGVDMKQEYLADVENIDFENGFIRNAAAPTLDSLPTEITTLVSGGYEILSAKMFTHTSQGDCTVYVLYYYGGGSHFVRIFLQNGSTVIELDPSQMCDTKAVYLSKPSNINYLYVNDSLRINLNCDARYTFANLDGTTSTETVKMNLALMYLSARKYNETYKISSDWHISPRWIGYTFNKSGKISLDGILSKNGGNRYTIDYSNITTNANIEMFQSAILGNMIGVQQQGYVRIKNLTNIGYFRIYSWTNIKRKIQVYIKDSVTNETLSTSIIDGALDTGLDGTYYWEVGFGNMDFKNKIYIDICAVDTNESETYLTTGDTKYYLTFNQIKLSGTIISGYAVVALQSDGQRNIILNYQGKYSSQLLYINPWGNLNISVNATAIDWRIYRYEIYLQISNLYISSYDETYGHIDKKIDTNNLYYLVNPPEDVDGMTDVTIANPEVNSGEIGAWNIWLGTGIVTNSITLNSLSSITLNYNYGLGSKIKTDIQSDIYSEVTYKNRSYFVKGDYRVYQSHISGTGKIQPDSFPYSAENIFGFFETSRYDNNLALAVTSLDELVILSKNRTYVYSIQGSLGTNLRKLKAINGSKGISAVNSLSIDLSGTSSAEVLLWCDNYGLYGFGGGINAPVDLTLGLLKNYWKNSLTDKTNCFGFYYQAKDEYWLVVDDKIIIYCLYTKVIKKYKFLYQIKQFLGIKNGKMYFICSDGNLYNYDSDVNTRLDASLITHYNTDTANTDYDGRQTTKIIAPEHEEKILQEVYLAVKDRAESYIAVNIIIDEAMIETALPFDTRKLTEVIIPGLAIRYGKIKFSLSIPASTATIREFGYSYIETHRQLGSYNTTVIPDFELPGKSSTITLDPTNITHVSFRANWRAVPDVKRYYLDVSLNSDFSTYLNGYHDKLIEGNTYCDLYGLNLDNNTYYYRVRTLSGSKPSDYSNVTSATYLKLYIVNTGNINANGATIYWASNKKATTKILYGITSDNLDNSVEIVDPTTMYHTLVLIGLMMEQMYYYRVQSTMADGEIATSDLYQFMTTKDYTFNTSGSILNEISFSNKVITNFTMNTLLNITDDNTCTTEPNASGDPYNSTFNFSNYSFVNLSIQNIAGSNYTATTN